MAKKKEETKKFVLERNYNVPLRKEWLKVPKYKRSKKAVKALREFIIKHMKGERVIIGKALNERVWQHGIKNPPHKISIQAKKDEEDVVWADLEGVEIVLEEPEKKEKAKEKAKEEPKKEEKKAKPAEEKPKEEPKKEEAAPEKPKEEEKKAEEPKKEVKEKPKEESKKISSDGK